jgi:hypothetical protein
VAARRLESDFGVEADRIQQIADEVDRELGEVEEAALAAPFPEPAEYAEFKP